MQPGQLRRGTGQLQGALAVASSTDQYVRKLVDELDARLTVDLPVAGRGDDLPARGAVGVLTAKRIEKDGCVVEEARHERGA